MQSVLFQFLQKYFIHIIISLVVISALTYLYLDYESLKEDKINLNKEIVSLNDNISNLKSDLIKQEQEKKNLESYYEEQLSLNKVAINITYNKQQELKTNISSLNNKVIKAKTSNQKENIKNLLDIIKEDSK